MFSLCELIIQFSGGLHDHCCEISASERVGKKKSSERASELVLFVAIEVKLVLSVAATVN